MSIRSFLHVRVRRLQPIVVLGAMLGLVQAAAYGFHRRSLDLPFLILLFMLSIVLVPYHPKREGGPEHQDLAFPLNRPTWSMFVEYAANVAFACLAKRLDGKLLAGVIAAGAIGTTVLTIHFGTLSFGFGQREIAFALARVCCSFFIGVALHRMYRQGAFGQKRLHPLAACILLSFVLAAPATVSAVPYALTAVFLLLPIILIVGIMADPDRERDARVMLFLGRTSYPLYIVHTPVFWLMKPVALRFLGDARLLSSLLAVAVALLIGWLAERYYDSPIQAWLKTRFSEPRSDAFRQRTEQNP